MNSSSLTMQQSLFVAEVDGFFLSVAIARLADLLSMSQRKMNAHRPTA